MEPGSVHFINIASNTDVQLCLRGIYENGTSVGVKIVVFWQNANRSKKLGVLRRTTKINGI